MPDRLRSLVGPGFGAALEAAPCGLLVVDEQGRILLVNGYAQRLFGYSAEELIGQPIEILVPKQQQDTHLAYRQQYLAAPEPRAMGAGRELHGRRRDGSAVAVEIGLGPLSTAAGQFVVASIVDITQRKHAEDQLQAALAQLAAFAERFRVALRASPVTVFHIDRELRYTWVHHPASGEPADAILGRTNAELLPPEIAEPLHRLMSEVLRTERGTRAEVQGLVQSRPVWFDLTLEPLRDASGAVVGLTGAAINIDEQKRREQQLADLAEENAKLSDELRRALLAHDQFLAAVTHDLRTPLTAVKATAQLLRRHLEHGRALEAEDISSHLANIESATTRMANMVESLLEATRLQAGEALVLERRPIRIVPMVQQVTAEARSLSSRHRFQLHIEAGLGDVMGDWDGPRLQRVFTSLVENAIKYSPAGGAITLTLARADQHEPAVVLTIRDEGLGIPDADRPRIFERFYRGSNVVGQIPGTGIGLTMARQIIELHGGTIDLESHPGAGTTVRVRIPVGEMSPPSAAP